MLEGHHIVDNVDIGRFRSEYLCRHWSGDSQGYCRAETCTGIVGDLQHMLLHCSALTTVRTRLWQMFFEKSVQYPALYVFLQRLEKSSDQIKMQFLLDPSAFPQIHEIWNLFGQPCIYHVYYLVRTYAYYMYRSKQVQLGYWTRDNLSKNRAKTATKRAGNQRLITSHSNPILSSGVLQPRPHATRPVQSWSEKGNHGVGAGPRAGGQQPQTCAAAESTSGQARAATRQGVPIAAHCTDHTIGLWHNGQLQHHNDSQLCLPVHQDDRLTDPPFCLRTVMVVVWLMVTSLIFFTA